MVYEKQRAFEELMERIRRVEKKPRATPSAVDLGEKKTIIPSPLQVFWAIVNSLPRLPAIPTTSKPPPPLTEVFERKHPSAEEEVTAPAEVAEEFPSPQTDINRLYILS